MADTSKWSSRWPLLAPILAVAVVLWAVWPAAVPESGLLVGKWNRDGDPYVLEVKSVGVGGQVEAAYFNPKPIRVATAKVSREGGLSLQVELSGDGYDGSRYALAYDPEDGKLKGEYAQGGGNRFPVSFTRAP